MARFVDPPALIPTPRRLADRLQRSLYADFATPGRAHHVPRAGEGLAKVEKSFGMR